MDPETIRAHQREALAASTAPSPRTIVHRSIAPPPVLDQWEPPPVHVAQPPRVPAWAAIAGMGVALLVGMLVR